MTGLKVEKMSSKEQRKQYIFVIKELTSREIKRKYARSYLGIVWSVLNPLLSMAVLSFIFSHMFSRSIDNYPIYYLTGSIIWHFFTGATNAAMTTLVDNKTMLIKVRIPMEVFIIARVYTALVNLGYSLIPYILMLIIFHIQIKWTIIIFPAVVFFELLFAMGVSFILSIAYVFFGDVKHLYSVLLTLWLYCSAIFYPIEKLPDYVKKVVLANPVFNYIHCARKVVQWGQLPTGLQVLQMVLWGVAVFLIGWYIFEKNKDKVLQKM